MVCGPMQGMSKRISWFSRATLTATAPPSFPASMPRGEASVGTLESFDREDDPVFDDDDLADLKARHFFCDAIAESTSSSVRRKALARRENFPRHQWLEPWRRFDEFNAIFAEFVGDRTEDRVRIFFFHAQEQREAAQVGANIKNVFRRDLAGHNTMADAGVLESGNQFGKLADTNPMHGIDQVLKGAIGFAGKTDGNDAFNPGATRLARDFKRQGTATGDDAKGVVHKRY